MAKITIRLEDSIAGECPQSIEWTVTVRSPGSAPPFWADGVQRAIQEAADRIIQQLEPSVQEGYGPLPTTSKEISNVRL